MPFPDNSWSEFRGWVGADGHIAANLSLSPPNYIGLSGTTHVPYNVEPFNWQDNSDAGPSLNPLLSTSREGD